MDFTQIWQSRQGIGILKFEPNGTVKFYVFHSFRKNPQRNSLQLIHPLVNADPKQAFRRIGGSPDPSVNQRRESFLH